jgi:hypothetical protein
VVTNNTANASGSAGKNGGLAQGGGLFVLGGGLNLVDTSVIGNTAAGNGGSGEAGGLAQGAGVFALSNLTASNSTVSGNVLTATGGAGPSNGAQGGGLVQGSGIFALTGPEQPVGFTGVTVGNNLADASGGPGGGGGTVQGGGVFLLATIQVSFTKTTIAANVGRNNGVVAGAAQGGGVFLGTGESPAALLSTTVSGNRIEPATSTGGGGNLFATGPVTFRNSIVANGAGPQGSENCFASEEISSLGFNIDNLDQCGFKAPGDKVNTDPLLGPLQSNGGLTQTLVPAPNSPAVDQGSASGLTADQRGVIRPIDLPSIPNSSAGGADGSDIGAVEFQPSNALTLGKLKKNKKKGTATLSVLLPQPSAGVLTLAGKGLKSQTKQITGQTELKLKVLPKGKVKKALRKKGKRKVQIKVTYTPTGNSAATATRKAKLVKKRRKHK